MRDWNAVSEFFEKHKDEYYGIWLDVCNIESPSDCKGGVDAVGRYFANAARRLGFDVKVRQEEVSGDALSITMNAGSCEAPVVFSSHIDTVHPIGLFGYPPTRIDGDRITGPGVMDCKGGAVAGLFAMAALKAAGFTDRPVKLILQSDEEVGSRTSGKDTVRFMAEEAKGAVAFLNGEAHMPGYACLIRKGILRYRLDIHGSATHSANCCSGCNAIREAAEKICRFEAVKEPDGLTFNCGVINGGTVANVVAQECTFTLDIRYPDEAARSRAEAIVREVADTSYIAGSSCDLTLISERVAMPLCDENLRLLDKVNGILESVGKSALKVTSRGSGSDASDITAYGIPTIDSIGVTGGNIHALGEYAYLWSLTESAIRCAAVAMFI